MRKPKARKSASLIPFNIIVAATSGDAVALDAVLKYYERYIIALSARRLYDENGRPYMAIDSDIRRRLETMLITKILQFDTTRTEKAV